MTNEELVKLIKEGDNGLLPQLWEQIRRFVEMMARRHYEKFDNKHGCELEDLIQAGYFGVVAAVRYYEPKKGFKFISYLEFPLKSAFNEAMGVRSSKRDWLNYAVSLDTPVGEDKDTSLLDMLGDMTPDTADVEEIIVEDVFNQELRAALDNAMEVLSKQQKNIIDLHYYFGLKFSQICEIKETSRQNIYNQHEEALFRIYCSRHRKILEAFIAYNHIPPDPYSNLSSRSWKESGNSSPEAFLLKNYYYTRRIDKKNDYNE